MRSDLWEYARTRLFTARIVTLWLVVFGAVELADGLGHGSAVFVDAVLLAAWIGVFRSWDDLADRGFDAVHHPDRVLVRTGYGRAFGLVAGALLSASLVCLGAATTAPHLVAAVALVVALALVYFTIPSAHRLRPFRTAAVLLKYPAFVLLLVDDPSSPRALAFAGAVYISLGLHETSTGRERMRAS